MANGAFQTKWKRYATSNGRHVYRPIWRSYIKSDGTTGYRPLTGWPKWYRISRCRPGELLGSLHQERRKCGKSNCRCASGEAEDLHGPYWVRRWRDEKGKQRKRYVKRSHLKYVRAAIARRKERLQEQREQRKKHMRRGEYSWKARQKKRQRGTGNEK